MPVICFLSRDKGCGAMTKPPESKISEKEIARRRDKIARRMLNTPPKPHPKRERDQSVTPKGKKAKETPAK